VAPRVAQREAALVPRLTSATPQGDHYVEVPALRYDIVDGQVGVPLEVRLVVVDQMALPFAGAVVDVWQANAQGVYSGVTEHGDEQPDTRGQGFLRGRQVTDRNGVASFRTIYPGWHTGRTAHIHFKVWNGEREVLTSQVFLPDALSEFIYTQVPEYRRSRARDTLNSQDSQALRAGNSVLGSVREEREQYLVTLAVAVDRSGRPATEPVNPDSLAATVSLPETSAEPARGDQRIRWVVPGKR
jgi:protocatechuate 3,4-dioxygenase beta subunit